MKNKFVLIGVSVLVVMFVGIGFLKAKRGLTESKMAKNPQVQKLYEEAMNLKNDRELLKAKDILQKIITENADYENIDTVEKELENLNMDIILSNTPTPKTVAYEVQVGDSLAKIAKKYKTTIDFIKRSNHLSRDTIRVGQKLRIWTGTFSIYVDKSQNILILKDGDEVVKVYHVSTGNNNSTPVGQFKIINKLQNPVWFKQGIAVPPESPENVLGTRWMGFDVPEYGIHGTVEPDKIGQQVTAGCVRMRNEDVEQLYSIIPEGTQVTIAD